MDVVTFEALFVALTSLPLLTCHSFAQLQVQLIKQVVEDSPTQQLTLKEVSIPGLGHSARSQLICLERCS